MCDGGRDQVHRRHREIANISTWIDGGVRYLEDLGNIPDDHVIKKRLEQQRLKTPLSGTLAFRESNGQVRHVIVTPAPRRGAIAATESGGWRFACQLPCRVDERIKNQDVAKAVERAIEVRSWRPTIGEFMMFARG
jgi:hypothetical protein